MMPSSRLVFRYSSSVVSFKRVWLEEEITATTLEG